MRQVIAYLLILLVVGGAVFAWRRYARERAKGRHSVRYRITDRD